MTESTSPMHSEAKGATKKACAWCSSLFTPKRRWAKFCTAKCRNEYHHFAKPQSVREARELVRLALTGMPNLTDWQSRARKLLGLKPHLDVIAEVKATIAHVNAAADRRDEVLAK